MRVLVAALIAASLAFSADRKAVTPEEPNVNLCVRGLSGCDVSALTPDELKKVAEASRKRNLDACMNLSTICDPTRLTKTEFTAVEGARYRRNLEKCQNGS